MSRQTVNTEELTKSFDYQAYPLGSTRYMMAREVTRLDSSHSGDRRYVFMKNDEGGTLAEGNVLVLGDAAGTGTVGNSPFYGVKSEGVVVRGRVACVVGKQLDGNGATTTVPSGYYFWGIVGGICEVLTTAGAITAGLEMTSTASASAIARVSSDTAATDTSESVFATALEANGSAAVNVAACIDLPWGL